MKFHTSLFSRLTLLSGAAMIALLGGSFWLSSCQQKPSTDAYHCRDRKVDVDAGTATGVVQDYVVVCGGKNLDWKEKNQEDWKVEFASSPFEQGEMQIKKGGNPHSKVKHVGADDVAFKYSITVNGTKHDPQIIVMGGT